jgi:hypothetical protein
MTDIVIIYYLIKGKDMAAKPTIQTILKTYNLEEILDLAIIKVRSVRDEKQEQAQMHLAALTHLVTGGQKESAKIKKTVQPISGRRGNKLSLGSHVLEVLGSQPMSVEEIMSAVLARGYKSQAKDLRRILYLELRKQIEKNQVNKAARGMYTRR